MSTTTLKKLSFEQFLEQYPDGYGIYELVNGEVVQVELIRAHKDSYLNTKCLSQQDFFASLSEAATVLVIVKIFTIMLTSATKLTAAMQSFWC